MPVIEVSHLTKEYRLGAIQGLKQNLLNTAARLTGKEVTPNPEYRAVYDQGYANFRHLYPPMSDVGNRRVALES